METRWLQDFLALADTGNFTRAAHARNASQAAFSRRIQALEGWLGATLVDRGAFPARLTAEGERFRREAGCILERILTTRGNLQGRPAPDRIRVAMPYAVATGDFPAWWAAWTAPGTGNEGLTCQVLLGNVHDMIGLLAAGTVDLLLCFDAAAQPLPLDAARYGRATLRQDRLQPLVRRGLLPAGAWPGRPGRPVPVLAYPQTVLFGRLVALAIEAAPAPLHADIRAECDMADVLRGLALAGQGVAWLPGCALRPGDADLLQRADQPAAGGRGMDAGPWSVNVATTAVRDCTQRRPALDRLWDRLAPP